MKPKDYSPTYLIIIALPQRIFGQAFELLMPLASLDDSPRGGRTRFFLRLVFEVVPGVADLLLPLSYIYVKIASTKW